MGIIEAYGGYAPGKPRITLTGPTQRPRRFIHPPQFAWLPLASATAYRCLLWSGPELIVDRTVTVPQLALTDVWEAIPPGRLRLTILALDGQGALCGFSNTYGFVKAPGWAGQIPPQRFSYAETATRIVRWLASDTGEGRYDPAAPPYFWHCVIDNADNSVTHNNRAFPSLHNPLGVQAFLAYAQKGEDPALRAEARRRACALADFTIAHSTPGHVLYAHLPYHTISQGRVGLHGARRADLANVVEPNKAGHMGVAYLDLFAATGLRKYREAALRIADTLVRTQRPDGSWPYRVDAETGHTEEPYTSTGVFALLLFDRVRRESDDPRYAAAYEKILTWMLDNPVRTGRWENMFDDTAYAEPYANPGNYDALFMGRFLLDHVAERPAFLDLAEAIFRWVDDNFVIYDPDDPSVPYRPYTPSVAEQWQYYWPMDVHTANWLLFLIRLWEVTGREEYRERAIGAANVLTQCQMTDGRSTTYVPDVDSGVRGGQLGRDDWYGCMFLPVTALLEAAEKLTER